MIPKEQSQGCPVVSTSMHARVPLPRVYLHKHMYILKGENKTRGHYYLIYWDGRHYQMAQATHAGCVLLCISVCFLPHLPRSQTAPSYQVVT